MKQVTRTVFEADDGTIFDTEAECRRHEDAVAERAKRTTYWCVIHNPDLTEGRGHYGCDYLEVYGPEPYYADDMVMDYCFKTYGPKTALVQGVAPMPNWMLSKIDRERFLTREPETRVGDYTHKGKKVWLDLVSPKEGLKVRP
jgi:hypothetical protein